MRVLHISNSDREGGAAIAARRLVIAQRAAGIDARMLVVRKTGDESWVHVAPGRTRAIARVARAVAKRAAQRMAAQDPLAMRSLGVVPTGLARCARKLSPDLVHWHWVGAETVSLGEMTLTGVPACWTAHDEWAWCGSEHYAADNSFATGYTGTSIDARNWRRKREAWRDFRPTIVAPSTWIGQRAQSSILFADAPVRVVPNTLDLRTFHPRDRAAGRARLGLPADRPIVLFGAQLGNMDLRKGFDLLVDAIHEIPEAHRDPLHLVAFGGRVPGIVTRGSIVIEELGIIDSEEKLADLYGAADLFVVPSRIDNLPNTVLEALACGTPCVGFNVGGLRDLVASPLYGRLVNPFDTAALGRSIHAMVGEREGHDRKGLHRQVADRYGPDRVSKMHQDIYEDLAEGAAT